jgi:hypothetical protein
MVDGRRRTLLLLRQFKTHSFVARCAIPSSDQHFRRSPFSLSLSMSEEKKQRALLARQTRKNILELQTLSLRRDDYSDRSYVTPTNATDSRC